jgi:hypothetical protein
MGTRKWCGASAALALILSAGVMTPPLAHAQLFGIQVSIFADAPPPPIPVYDQPPIPAVGYIWTPGYWAWGEDIGDYYWVPGTWILPPQPGLLWTPGYWGWANGRYGFIDGYWGPQVGFYGGVDYGFGYGGSGYSGGYWRGGQLYYNRTVNNIRNVNVTNVYVQQVPRRQAPGPSYNGGPGGVQARPTPQQLTFARAPHVAPTSAQRQQVSTARQQPQLRASANQGRPPIAATQRPAAFSGPGAVPARVGGAYHAPPPRNGPAAANRGPQPSDAPAARALAPGNRGPQPGAPTSRAPESQPRPSPPAQRPEGQPSRPPPARESARQPSQPAPSAAQARSQPHTPPPGPQPQARPQPQAQRPAPRPPEKAPPKTPEEEHHPPQ